jgi:hypothetical protein
MPYSAYLSKAWVQKLQVATASLPLTAKFYFMYVTTKTMNWCAKRLSVNAGVGSRDSMPMQLQMLCPIAHKGKQTAPVKEQKAKQA